MTNNSLFGAFIAGMGFTLALVAIYQIGINIGIKTVINMLDGEYPAAMKYLNKHRQSARILPLVIGGNNHE